MERNNRDMAIDAFKNKKNCGQAVYLQYYQMLGITEEEAITKMALSGRSTHKGEGQCGTLTAALDIVTLFYQMQECKMDDNVKSLDQVLSEFMGAFQKNHESVICKELSKEQRLNHPNPYVALYKPKCHQLLAEVCDMLDVYLNRFDDLVKKDHQYKK